MPYLIVPYDAIDRVAYGELLAACPTATVFHTLEWMRIYPLFGSGTKHFLALAEEGGKLLAAMPVTVFAKFCVQAVFSSGFSGYGGPIVRPECPPEVTRELVQQFAASFLTWRTVLGSVHDFDGLCGPLREYGFTAEPTATYQMALPATYAELEKNAKSTAKYRVRRALKAGVQVDRSKRAEDFEAWQRLCTRNYVAHGRRPYPAALYRAVWQAVQESDTFRFYAARLGGRVVGGTVQVFALHQVFYWMSATHDDCANLGVNDAVFHAVFHEAIAEGCKQFDFGASPVEAAGLIRFKEKWGGVEKPYVHYSYANRLGRLGRNLVRYGRFSAPHS
jgi:CelD/BcsL family acetyltransferase involved in cellulose biosynthesis